MNAVWNSYGQLCGCPEIFKKSCKFFCRELDIRVAKIMKPHLRHPVFCYVLRNDRTTAGSANIGIVGTENQDRKRTGRQRLTPLPACSKKSIT